MVSPPGTNFTAESTEAMRIMCLAQGHNILMLPGFEPSTFVSRNRHPYLQLLIERLVIIYRQDIVRYCAS